MFDGKWMMEKKILTYCDLGFIDYKEAWDLQQEIHSKRVANEADDFLFLLEHPNTYTLGKTAHKENLVGSEDYLKQNQISVYDIDRGGDITYHGPGQIVGYPIIDLNNWFKDTHKYLRALEEVIIKTCENYGLQCGRNEKHTGVWIDDRKIAAIGIKVSRWVTMHGFAFNINTDLNLFKGIIPCGIQDKSVTSLSKELKKEIDTNEVKEILLRNFFTLFSYEKIRVIQKVELYNQIFQPHFEKVVQ
ncbi:MAG: lipoyl(octanoyl) transferase LipB [Ignavibacteriaceae bacterium]|nr:lipoyl(octanoyl) transferase LipB [Ignavibacteriaceae bacterium]